MADSNGARGGRLGRRRNCRLKRARLGFRVMVDVAVGVEIVEPIFFGLPKFCPIAAILQTAKLELLGEVED